jgi:hypothetical protein
MMTRLEYACFQANPDCEMDVGMGLPILTVVVIMAED